jgi:hypothetical protein
MSRVKFLTRGQLIAGIEDMHAAICEALTMLSDNDSATAITYLKGACDTAAEFIQRWESEDE